MDGQLKQLDLLFEFSDVALDAACMSVEIGVFVE